MCPCFLGFSYIDTVLMKFRSAENLSVAVDTWLFVMLPATNVRSCINISVQQQRYGKGLF